MTHSVKKTVKKECVGVLRGSTDNTVVFQIYDDGTQTKASFSWEDFEESDYVLENGKIYETKEVRRCKWCNQPPIYDENEGEYYCPICK